MQKDNQAGFTLEFLRAHLKGLSDLDLFDPSEGMHELLAGLVAMMNMLRPEGYADAFPAVTFRPIQE